LAKPLTEPTDGLFSELFLDAEILVDDKIQIYAVKHLVFK
jgi:hypothetical protein